MSSQVNLDPPASNLRPLHLASFAQGQGLQSIPAFMSLLGMTKVYKFSSLFRVIPRIGLDRILPRHFLTVYYGFTDNLTAKC